MGTRPHSVQVQPRSVLGRIEMIVAWAFLGLCTLPALAAEGQAPLQPKELALQQVLEDPAVAFFVDADGVRWTLVGYATEFARVVDANEVPEDQEEDSVSDDGSYSMLLADGREFVSEPLYPEVVPEDPSTEGDVDSASAVALQQILPPANTNAPWRQVVRLSSGCSGAMVGPRHVLTAAHCLHEGRRRGRWISQPPLPAVRPGVAGSCVSPDNCPYSSTVSVALVVPTRWRRGIRRRWPMDRGMVILADRLGDATGWFDYRAVSGGTLRSARVTTAGYPGNRPFQTMWTDTCSVRLVLPRRFRHRCEAYGGQSGSGYWLENTNTLVGIHSGDAVGRSERATRMNDKAVDMIRKQLRLWP